MIISTRLIPFVLLALTVLPGCGGADGSPPASQTGVVIQISPQSARIGPASTAAFAATVTGTSNTAVSWSVREAADCGSVSQAGVYSATVAPATSSRTCHVVVTSRADSSQSATATVTITASVPPPTPVAVSVSPRSPVIAVGAQQRFVATVTGTSNVAVTWSVQEGSPAAGTVDSSGNYTAPAAVGTYHVVATSVADLTKSDTATVVVNETSTGTSSAAALARKLGRPARLLFGLGNGCAPVDIQAQQISPDFYDRYLVGLPGSGGWPDWNAGGTYVDIVAGDADSVGAVPMYTLYQMAAWGDGNLAGLSNTAFMTSYWSAAKLLFQRLGVYNKVAVVQFEPDFWGYAQQQSPQGDPTRLAVQVKLAADCADLPNDLTGMGRCLVRLARTYAPKALVGFPPAEWGAPSTSALVAFMNKVGVPDGDFVVMQTLDRDAGCFEAASQSDCQRSGNFYWDETNTTSPNFREHLSNAKAISGGLGKPLIWWQTPLGVPSSTPGGTQGHYRDNRVHYIFSHPQEFVDAGAVGVVFGTGADGQTSIATDNGQFKAAAAAYFAHPTPLP